MNNKTRGILCAVVSAVFLLLTIERYTGGASMVRTAISAAGTICFAIIAYISFKRAGGSKRTD